MSANISCETRYGNICTQPCYKIFWIVVSSYWQALKALKSVFMLFFPFNGSEKMLARCSVLEYAIILSPLSIGRQTIALCFSNFFETGAFAKCSVNILKIHNSLISLGFVQAIARAIHWALSWLKKNFQEVLASWMLKNLLGVNIGTKRKSLIERQSEEYNIISWPKPYVLRNSLRNLEFYTSLQAF